MQPVAGPTHSKRVGLVQEEQGRERRGQSEKGGRCCVDLWRNLLSHYPRRRLHHVSRIVLR